MFDNVRLALEKMPEQTQTDVANLTFLGFSANDEARHMNYAIYYCTSGGGRFEHLSKGDNFNSHVPVLETYRAKLAAWNQSAERHSLTSSDLNRIAAAH